MIVFCGYGNLDVVGRVARLPRPDERVHATAVEQLSGGMAANAAVAAARSGGRAAFAGVLGSDPFSDRFLGELADEGVDTSWSDRSAYLSTAIILVDADGRRSVVSQDDALGIAHVAAVADRLAAREGGLLYLDGYRAAQLGSATRPGITLAVDLDGCEDRSTALEALARADHVVVGRHRLEQLLDVPERTWSRLAVDGGSHLVVTDGARGWRLYAADGTVSAGAALPVHVVDDTGAGDCFVGTYLAGLDAGLPPVVAATRAGVGASLSCTVRGARGAPGPGDVDAHLPAQPGSGAPAVLRTSHGDPHPRGL